MRLKSNHQTSFTSIHIFRDKYILFKEAGITSGMTLQKLVNRCVYLYTNDPDFKAKINSTNDLQISGSAF
jgi:hypothetical protein